MTEMTDAARQVYRARNTVHNAIMDLGRERGAEMVTRERIRGDAAFGTVRDLPPIDGLKAARDIEFAAQHHFRDYMRQAREAGHSWRAIGEGLDLAEKAREKDLTVAEAAFDLAAGDRDSYYALTYGRSVTWRCGECNGLVIDHGPGDAGTHQPGCQRFAREQAGREREWQQKWEGS
jgi:hypothetical protein